MTTVYLFRLFIFSWAVDLISVYSLSCQPKNRTFALVGEDIKLMCLLIHQEVLNSSSSQSFGNWIKDDEKVLNAYHVDVSQRISQTLTTSIAFRNLNISDSGYYWFTCFLDRTLLVSDKIQLVVQPQPIEPICNTSKTHYITGETVSLKCHTYNYHSLKLYWTGKLSDDQRLYYITNNTRIIEMSFVGDTIGIMAFTCVMKFKLGDLEGPLFCDVNVNIKMPLDVKITGLTMLRFEHKIVLRCSVVGEYALLHTNVTSLDNKDIPTKSSMLQMREEINNDQLGLHFQWVSNNSRINTTTNGSSLTIQFFAGRVGSLVTCTVTQGNNSEGSESIVLNVYPNMTTQLPSTANSFTTDMHINSIEHNYTVVYLATISITLVVILLLSIKCIIIKYSARRRLDKQIHVATIQAIIRTDNNTIHSIPLSLVSSASINTFGNNPSLLSIVDSLQETRMLDRWTGLSGIRSARSNDTLPSLPEITRFGSPWMVQSVMSEEDDQASEDEVLTHPLYDEINDPTFCYSNNSNRVTVSLSTTTKHVDDRFNVLEFDQLLSDPQYNAINKTDNTLSDAQYNVLNEMEKTLSDPQNNVLCENDILSDPQSNVLNENDKMLPDYQNVINENDKMLSDPQITVSENGKIVSDPQYNALIENEKNVSDPQNVINENVNMLSDPQYNVLNEHFKMLSDHQIVINENDKMLSDPQYNVLNENDHMLLDPQYNVLNEI